ncbi:MAG: hypothetical protein Q4G07_04290 [Oscillospiraceae bacterium]|nr:hypothetical protein [Oscillospiraceae bacterium]
MFGFSHKALYPLFSDTPAFCGLAYRIELIHVFDPIFRTYFSLIVYGMADNINKQPGDDRFYKRQFCFSKIKCKGMKKLTFAAVSVFIKRSFVHVHNKSGRRRPQRTESGGNLTGGLTLLKDGAPSNRKKAGRHSFSLYRPANVRLLSGPPDKTRRRVYAVCKNQMTSVTIRRTNNTNTIHMMG